MTRRRRQAPDTRPDWRDPAMPVIRRYKLSNGQMLTDVDPDYETRYREFLLTQNATPPWYRDPTYNLRRKK